MTTYLKVTKSQIKKLIHEADALKISLPQSIMMMHKMHIHSYILLHSSISLRRSKFKMHFQKDEREESNECKGFQTKCHHDQIKAFKK